MDCQVDWARMTERGGLRNDERDGREYPDIPASTWACTIMLDVAKRKNIHIDPMKRKGEVMRLGKTRSSVGDVIPFIGDFLPSMSMRLVARKLTLRYVTRFAFREGGTLFGAFGTQRAVE